MHAHEKGAHLVVPPRLKPLSTQKTTAKMRSLIASNIGLGSSGRTAHTTTGVTRGRLRLPLPPHQDLRLHPNPPLPHHRNHRQVRSAHIRHAAVKTGYATPLVEYAHASRAGAAPTATSPSGPARRVPTGSTALGMGCVIRQKGHALAHSATLEPHARLLPGKLATVRVPQPTCWFSLVLI